MKIQNFKSIIILNTIFFYSIVLNSCGFKKEILFYTKTNESGLKDSSVFYLKKENLLNQPSNQYSQTILPGNQLSIRNLQNDTQLLGYTSGNLNPIQIINYQVDSDSTVILPSLGKLKLGGLTIDEAEKLLNKNFSLELMKNPLIKISITNLSVTVLGEFNKQGQIILEKNNTHLIELLGMVGGINKRAEIRKVKIIRGNYNKPNVILVNLNDLNSLSDERLYLKNNDIIYVETNAISKFKDSLGATGAVIGVLTSLIGIYLIINR